MTHTPRPRSLELAVAQVEENRLPAILAVFAFLGLNLFFLGGAAVVALLQQGAY